MPRPPETNPGARSPAAWLLATAAVTLAPHALHLPLWMSGLCALLLAWRTHLLVRIGAAPSRVLILALALAVAIGVRYEFGHFFGKDPGVALLAVLLCLKQFEVRSPRDVHSAVLLSFFLQLGLFLHDQTLLIAAFALAGALFATVTLLRLQDGEAPTRESLRSAGLMMAQAVPFLLALFLLFPRVPGPLWGLPADAFSGTTGLSDSMEPGSISELILSEAIAFRAEFTGAAPPREQRYWRGPVLTAFDGRSWRAVPTLSTATPPYTPFGPRYDYALTLEAHNRPWILALDFPGPGAAGARYATDLRLLADRPVRHRTRFALTAYPETPVGRFESPGALAIARQLPSDTNPRTVALARELAEGAPDDETILARVLDHMRELGLVYTLRPPLLGRHSADEFLFDTRRGFCEHFASAFVVLMRAAGVPSRVVTGYQGGEINPIDGSMVVRQSDAHAWAEVWLDGRGWVRVDPTALAAPSRIDAGLAAALPQGELLPLMMRPALSWLRAARHRWEAVSNAWNQWVLGYDTLRQHELMRRLGVAEPDWRTLSALLAASTGVLMLLLLAWAHARHRAADPLDRAWDAFCAKLARRGLPRLPWEGPMDYAGRVAAALPTRAGVVRTIAAAYARLRYGGNGPADPAATRALARSIQRFKPK